MLIASALKLVTLTNIIKLQHPQHNNCFIWCLVSGLKFSLSFLSTNITEVYFPGLDINFAPWWQFREASEGCSGALQDSSPISPRQWPATIWPGRASHWSQAKYDNHAGTEVTQRRWTEQQPWRQSFSFYLSWILLEPWKHGLKIAAG